MGAVQAARMNLLPESELLNYMNAMVTEEEKQDVGAAYYEDGYEEGMAVGEAKGLAKGKAETLKKTARNLLKMKLKVEDIAKATGLSVEEINAF